MNPIGRSRAGRSLRPFSAPVPGSPRLSSVLQAAFAEFDEERRPSAPSFSRRFVRPDSPPGSAVFIGRDEPTTAIDSISQYAIMQEFMRIKASRAAAMIFISHDLGVLSLISDKLVVMHRGLAVERGLPEEIFEHAKDPYTRELIDRHTAVMNTFSRAIRGEVVHAA